MESIDSGPVRLRLLIAVTGVAFAAAALFHAVGISHGHGVLDVLVRLALLMA